MQDERKKVSELDEYSGSLEGFYTLGTKDDSLGRPQSHKVNLGFVQRAADNANEKATLAGNAASSANTAASNANEKAALADEKATLAGTKAAAAQTAADNADRAVEKLNKSRDPKKVLASPTAASGVPEFRSLVMEDVSDMEFMTSQELLTILNAE